MLVVLVPGTGEPADNWAPIAEPAVARGCRVLTPDLPGYGSMADAMPRAQYVELDDTAHGGPIFWADRVVPHLLDFWDAHREGG